DAVFIFECKNTVENIGKNEILLFAEKIKATSATRGFFVAKGFGEYARAQAGQFPRIVLLHASENVLSTGAFKNFGMVGTINPNLRFTLRERNGSGVVKPTEASVATYNKKKYPFSEFIERTIE